MKIEDGACGQPKEKSLQRSPLRKRAEGWGKPNPACSQDTLRERQGPSTPTTSLPPRPSAAVCARARSASRRLGWPARGGAGGPSSPTLRRQGRCTGVASSRRRSKAISTEPNMRPSPLDPVSRTLDPVQGRSDPRRGEATSAGLHLPRRRLVLVSSRAGKTSLSAATSPSKAALHPPPTRLFAGGSPSWRRRPSKAVAQAEAARFSG
ncbi:hypothetical protein PVAP13_8NG324012 [Panicum virgatum]|uniref:Uncharacterized protein n=1 Tax=Panicum virgatum TaxID=38727 RepID=A0A8T0PDA4_PANVG|nr:hypothetical protein PVAP13_8NG324012 [Panicum virgatum]